MKIRILDLDNCISNDEWRIPFIDWNKEDATERYYRYHAGCALDDLGNSHLIENLEHDEFIVIFTARPEYVRRRTSVWLSENVRSVFMMFMREENDHSSSVEVKKRMLLDLKERAPAAFNNITAAYDDKPEIVEMYKSFGINAHVASIHNTSAYQQEK